jgi:hypothetical protein
MSLDKKQGQNKLFAFEINNIMKSLRALAQNIISLNRSAHWEFISSEGLSNSQSNSSTPCTDTGTIPPDCNFIVLKISHSVSGWYWNGQVILAREGITSQTLKQQPGVDSDSYWSRVASSISGSVLTCTQSCGSSWNSTSRNFSVTAYYYR